MIAWWWLLIFAPAIFGLGMLCLAMLLTAGGGRKRHGIPNEPRQEK